jgi:hypothetical protein
MRVSVESSGETPLQFAEKLEVGGNCVQSRVQGSELQSSGLNLEPAEP